ncbi:MAG: hypothetical protein Kow0031_30840 [Anaerolineae bacterium]
MSNQTTSNTRAIVLALQRGIWWLSKYWVVVAMLLAVGFFTLALLAPALMAEGYTEAGQRVYRLLAPHDHQLPQRSYFLFGQNGLVRSYSLEQVLAWGADPSNLRAFVGNPEIGFKMGLNYRMTAIFAGIVLGGIVWVFAGGRPQLGWGWLLLLTLPLLLDAFSHRSSEITGSGWRETNLWAVSLTGGALPPQFASGTTIGTLNWLLRTVTGFIFGLGLVWALFTFFGKRFAGIQAQLKPKFARQKSKTDL